MEKNRMEKELVFFSITVTSKSDHPSPLSLAWEMSFRTNDSLDWFVHWNINFFSYLKARYEPTTSKEMLSKIRWDLTKVTNNPGTSVTASLHGHLSIYPTYVKYSPWVFSIISNFVAILKYKGNHIKHPHKSIL